MQDGVYFNLDENIYHKLPRLSGSGIKEILVSISTYWAKSAMNPDREEADPDSVALILGHAYHTAIFEPDELEKRFVCEPDPDDYPDALMTDAAVKRELKDSGQTQTKSGELAIERAERLLASGYDGEIWSIIMDRWEQQRGDRQALKVRYWRQIQRDIKRIKDNPEIHDMVSGGASEVTILWTCPKAGIAMKARLDKLKPDRFIDLKSFTNTKRKPVNRCLLDQVMYERHYIQARLYQLAVEMIKEQDLQIMDKPTDDQAFTPPAHVELIDKIKANPKPHDVWYLYQEKNGIPNLLARRMVLQHWPDGHEFNAIGAEDRLKQIAKHDTILARKADIEIDHAKKLYNMALEVYGADQPWFPFDMIGEIYDDDFSDYFLDRVPA